MRLEDVWLRYHRRGRGCCAASTCGSARARWRSCSAATGPASPPCSSSPPGVLRPSRGRVVDRPAAVGWVPERFPADQPFTVTALPHRDGPGRRARRGRRPTGRWQHWTDRLGLTRFRGVRLPQLSKGTAQKVGLAQAMLRPPGPAGPRRAVGGPGRRRPRAGPELIDEVLAGGGSGAGQRPPRRDGPAAGARRWTRRRRHGHRGGAAGGPADRRWSSSRSRPRGWPAPSPGCAPTATTSSGYATARRPRSAATRPGTPSRRSAAVAAHRRCRPPSAAPAASRCRPTRGPAREAAR